MGIRNTQKAFLVLQITFHFFHNRITEMQQQKENLTAQVNGTAAEQLGLEEEAAALNLALGNITSSLHQLALTDATPSPQAGTRVDHTTEVSAQHLMEMLLSQYGSTII